MPMTAERIMAIHERVLNCGGPRPPQAEPPVGAEGEAHQEHEDAQGAEQVEPAEARRDPVQGSGTGARQGPARSGPQATTTTVTATETSRTGRDVDRRRNRAARSTCGSEWRTGRREESSGADGGCWSGGHGQLLSRIGWDRVGGWGALSGRCTDSVRGLSGERATRVADRRWHARGERVKARHDFPRDNGDLERGCHRRFTRPKHSDTVDGLTAHSSYGPCMPQPMEAAALTGSAGTSPRRPADRDHQRRPPPGTPLSEIALAEQHGVSRTRSARRSSSSRSRGSSRSGPASAPSSAPRAAARSSSSSSSRRSSRAWGRASWPPADASPRSTSSRRTWSGPPGRRRRRPRGVRRPRARVPLHDHRRRGQHAAQEPLPHPHEPARLPPAVARSLNRPGGSARPCPSTRRSCSTSARRTVTAPSSPCATTSAAANAKPSPADSPTDPGGPRDRPLTLTAPTPTPQR